MLRCHKNSRGFVLLMVLWIIIVLMVVVMSFSLLAKTESFSTLYFRDSITRQFLAEAGIERAIMEIYYRQANRGGGTITEGEEIVRADGSPTTGILGNDRYTFRIYNEAGKINLNLLNDQNSIILNNLLINLGVGQEIADTIVDSVLDWIDSDSLHRVHGAEDEYYGTLQNPYKARNGPMDVPEDLLLIRGVAPDILFGTKDRKGLIHFVTTYGKMSKINVNFAPKELIMSLPGITEDVADKIIQSRAATPLKSLDDIRGLMGACYSGAAQFLETGESNIFTIESAGFLENDKNGYSIRALVMIESPRLYRYLYYKTPAEGRR